MLIAPNYLPLTYLFVLGSIWGLHFSVIKLASQSGLQIDGIAATTSVGVFVAFFTIAVFRRRLPAFSLSAWRFYIICALTGYVIPFVLEITVARVIDAGLLTIVVTTTPILTILIAGLLRIEVITRRRVGALILGGVAAMAIIFPESAVPAREQIPWVALAFLVPLLYALYHNYVAVAWPAGADSWQVACGESLGALVFFAPVYLWRGNYITFQGAWGHGEWAILLMIVFGLVEVFLYFEIVRLAGAVFVSLANYITIASGNLFGFLIFDERPSYWVLLSIAVLCFALYLSGESKVQAQSR